MLVTCQLVTDQISNYLPDHYKNKTIKANKNNTTNNIYIIIPDKYLKYYDGYKSIEIPQWNKLGLDHTTFKVEILPPDEVAEGDIIIFNDITLFIYKLEQ